MQRDLPTTVLGVHLAFPVIVSPAGAQALDPRARPPSPRRPRHPIGLSSFASHTFRSLVRENAKALYQLFWVGRRVAVAGGVHQCGVE